MRRQQEIWLTEHNDLRTLPTMANVRPASGMSLLVEHLTRVSAPFSGHAIDIGSGKGRNTVYLATLGFNVKALDYIVSALAAGRELAKRRHVEDRVDFREADIDAPWQFDSNYFDVAVDYFSSIDIETRAGRRVCRDEMYRTLKPGGHALVAVCSAEDEWERELIDTHPGPEPNSTYWPHNGKFQKNYSEPELLEFYSRFNIVKFKKVKKPAYKQNRTGIATNLLLLLSK
jgi:SAM-dependent methyltransferase